MVLGFYGNIDSTFTPELHPNRMAQDKSYQTKRKKSKKISVHNAQNGIKQPN